MFQISERFFPITKMQVAIRPPTPDDVSIRFIETPLPESLYELPLPLLDYDTPETPWDVRLRKLLFCRETGERLIGLCCRQPQVPEMLDWLDDPTTEKYNEIFTYQEFSLASRFWLLTEFGRGLFPLGTMDNGQRFTYIIGPGGTPLSECGSSLRRPSTLGALTARQVRGRPWQQNYCKNICPRANSAG